MHSHGALRTPLRDCVKRISGRSSRAERLLVLGCLSLGGVSGWNERTLHTHTARVDSLPLAPVPPARDDRHGGVHLTNNADGASACFDDAGADAARKPGSTRGHQASGGHDASIDRRSGAGVAEHDRRYRQDGGSRIDTAGDDDAHCPPAGASTTTDMLPHTVAQDEGSAEVPASSGVSRVSSNAEKIRGLEQDSNYGREGEQAISDFDAALAQTAARPRDAMTRQQPADFLPDYYRRVQDRSKRRLSRVIQSSRRQRDQAGIVNPRLDQLWFQTTLQKLKDASGEDPSSFLKRNEVISLPENYRAVFKTNAEEAVLEVLFRTGCHVQRLPVKDDSAMDLFSLGKDGGDADLYAKGFESLSLYGTAEENEAAFRLLHDMVQVVSSSPSAARGQWLAAYDVKRQVRSQSACDDSAKLLEEQLLAVEPDAAAYLDNRDAGNDSMAADESGNNELKTPSVPVRSVWSRPPPRILPDEQPRDWTAVSFANHIADLAAHSRRSRNDNFTRVKSSHAVTARRILACFDDAAAAPFISSEAVDTALSYFLENGDYRHLKSLLHRLESIPAYELQTRNFDILLQHSASRGHWLSYRRYLGQWLQRNLQPSWLTWATFHEVLCREYASTSWSAEARHAMEDLGVLRHPRALQRVARNHLERALELWIRNRAGKNVDDFLVEYDSAYITDLVRPFNARQMVRSPRPWLSAGSANYMIRILLSHGRTSDALKVVQALETSARTVGTATVNTFLTAAYLARDAKFAVQLLQHFSPGLTRLRDPIRLDDVSYYILFCIAWRKQCLNMLRVIWRYSCALGLVRGQIRERIRTSLLGYWPPHGAREELERAAVSAEQRTEVGRRRGDALTQIEERKKSRRGEVFFAFAGKFVLGVREHLRRNAKKDAEVGYAIKTGSGDAIAHGDANDDLKGVVEQAQQVAKSSASDAASNSHIDNSTFISQQDLLILCAQPRHSDPSGCLGREAAHKNRNSQLLSLLDTDVHTQRHPAVAIAEMLGRAFELDMQWHKSGMGTSKQRLGGGSTLQEVIEKEGMGEDEKALAFGEAFAGILLEGLQTPMARLRPMPRRMENSDHDG